MFDAASLINAMPLAAGWDVLSPTVAPIIIEEPTTLELALVGILTLGIYSVAGRYRRRIRADQFDHAAADAQIESPVGAERQDREAA
jgi:hypothetical protein